jgi:hypothetical protein
MKLKLFLLISIISGIVFYACKDKSNDPGPDPVVDKCVSKTITLTATMTPAEKCQSNGKLVLRAKGSTNFSFQMNAGAFKTDSTFSNLPAGTYTFIAKDIDGCTKSASFTVTETGTKGPLYTFVASIIGAKCVNGFCHGTGNQDPNAPKGIFATDCGIIARKELIKTNNWYLAGGRYTD